MNETSSIVSPGASTKARPVIEARELLKVYQMGRNEVQALRGVSFVVQPGEMVAIIGASGSGKSTLMNILGCLDRPTSGTYLLDGVHVETLKKDELAAIRNRKIGFVFQGYNLLARITADLGRPPLRLDPAALKRIVEAAWPGNVRELANVLERAAILVDGDVIHVEDLVVGMTESAHLEGESPTMIEIERQAIRQALEECGGNRRRAAERLAIGERTLYEKLKRYGIG